MRGVLRADISRRWAQGVLISTRPSAWRNWRLSQAATGLLESCLPRSALQTKGSEQWRKTVLAERAPSATCCDPVECREAGSSTTLTAGT